MNPYSNILEPAVPPLMWFAIITCAIVGVLALVRPTLLASANSKSSRWIDSQKLFEALDKQFHVDQFVLQHNRVFGVLSLLTAVGLLAFYFT